MHPEQEPGRDLELVLGSGLVRRAFSVVQAIEVDCLFGVAIWKPLRNRSSELVPLESLRVLLRVLRDVMHETPMRIRVDAK